MAVAPGATLTQQKAVIVILVFDLGMTTVQAVKKAADSLDDIDELAGVPPFSIPATTAQKWVDAEAVRRDLKGEDLRDWLGPLRDGVLEQVEADYWRILANPAGADKWARSTIAKELERVYEMDARCRQLAEEEYPTAPPAQRDDTDQVERLLAAAAEPAATVLEPEAKPEAKPEATATVERPTEDTMPPLPDDYAQRHGITEWPARVTPDFARHLLKLDREAAKR